MKSNLLNEYNSQSRLAIGRIDKDEIVLKLKNLLQNHRDYAVPVIKAMVDFKAARSDSYFCSGKGRQNKKLEDLEESLNIFETQVEYLDDDVDYPSMQELMALLRNSGFIMQRDLPAHLKRFLVDHQDVLGGIFDKDNKSFLKSNGLLYVGNNRENAPGVIKRIEQNNVPAGLSVVERERYKSTILMNLNEIKNRKQRYALEYPDLVGQMNIPSTQEFKLDAHFTETVLNDIVRADTDPQFNENMLLVKKLYDNKVLPAVLSGSQCKQEFDCKLSGVLKILRRSNALLVMGRNKREGSVSSNSSSVPEDGMGSCLSGNGGLPEGVSWDEYARVVFINQHIYSHQYHGGIIGLWIMTDNMRSDEIKLCGGISYKIIEPNRSAQTVRVTLIGNTTIDDNLISELHYIYEYDMDIKKNGRSFTCTLKSADFKFA